MKSKSDFFIPVHENNNDYFLDPDLCKKCIEEIINSKFLNQDLLNQFDIEMDKLINQEMIFRVVTKKSQDF